MKTISKYGRVFDSNCKKWIDSRIHNEIYLKHINEYFNDILKYRGYVFLRDIYEELGFPVTAESIVAGWTWNRDSSVGDVIEFTICEDGADLTVDFINVNENILTHF